MNEETIILARIRLAIGALHGVRVWRNHIGFDTRTERRWSAAFAASGVDSAMLASEGGSA